MKPLWSLPYAVTEPYFDHLIWYKRYRFDQVFILFPKLETLRITKMHVGLFPKSWAKVSKFGVPALMLTTMKLYGIYIPYYCCAIECHSAVQDADAYLEPSQTPKWSFLQKDSTAESRYYFSKKLHLLRLNEFWIRWKNVIDWITMVAFSSPSTFGIAEVFYLPG